MHYVSLTGDSPESNGNLINLHSFSWYYNSSFKDLVIYIYTFKNLSGASVVKSMMRQCTLSHLSSIPRSYIYFSIKKPSSIHQVSFELEVN